MATSYAQPDLHHLDGRDPAIRKKEGARSRCCPFGKFSSRPAISWTRSPKGGGRRAQRHGKTCCCAAWVWGRQRCLPARDVSLLRMVPFVERNYNMVELGPRGTGKSHLFQQVSPYAHLISGGKATVARMFVNMANGQRGLVCQYDVVCFDEVSGVSFDQKDGVNIMKGYMESRRVLARPREHPRRGHHRAGRQFRGRCPAPAARRPPVRAVAA